MRTSTMRSSYEQSLSVAHRALYRASDQAEQLGDVGAAEDLHELLKHISVLMDSSLRNKKRPVTSIAGQLNLCD
jgi:hypothetical protein